MSSESFNAASNYDDQGMIAYTIIYFHDHLLTEFERSVLFAFRLRWRSESNSASIWERLLRGPELPEEVADIRQIREWRELLHDPSITPVLEKGYGAFSDAIAERVMHERGSEVVLARCPSCRRIVRTPRARQCMWCYHDWHLRLA